MRILVTGGAGFIGSHTCLVLLEKGYEKELSNILNFTNKSGISTRPAWELMHTLKMYKDCPRAPLPIAESLAKRIINIPSSAFLI